MEQWENVAREEACQGLNEIDYSCFSLLKAKELINHANLHAFIKSVSKLHELCIKCFEKKYICSFVLKTNQARFQ